MQKQVAIAFRADINGLRAVAVTSVVLFHAQVHWISGGFVGVDIFFVISGFLMTKILHRQMDGGRVDVFKFYRARARRIWPGLIGVCIALLVFGAVWIYPTEYSRLSEMVGSALLFVSNIQFWREAGYFDQRSEGKWLLNSWSLSTEWQFYLVYPLLFIAALRAKSPKFTLRLLVWLCLAASLALSVVITPFFVSGSFYLLPTRAWELLAGAVVALYLDRSPPPKWLAYALNAAGLALIAFSIVWFDRSSIWPGSSAILPVAGAVLVIAARRETARIWANPPVQLIGSWSYAIYLWHWPLFVIENYFELQLPIWAKLALLTLIVAGGAILLKRLGRSLQILLDLFSSGARASFPRPIATSFVLTGLMAAAILLTNGLDIREGSRRVQEISFRQAMKDRDFPASCTGMDKTRKIVPCRTGDHSGHDILVLGDSFAEQIFPRAKVIAANTNSRFTFLTLNGCPPAPNVDRQTGGLICNEFFQQAMHMAETQNYERLMLVSIWYTYFTFGPSAYCFLEDGECVVETDVKKFEHRLDTVFDELQRALARVKVRTPITIVLPTPFSHFDVPSELSKRVFFGKDVTELLSIDRAEFLQRYGGVRARLKKLAENIGASIIDPLDTLCSETQCATVDADGTPLFRDSSHYRASVTATSKFVFLDKAVQESSTLASDPKVMN